MAERDKIIKSGQLTLPRILFLAAFGGVIVFTVYAGGIFLTLGYWLLTLSICVLLFLIAIDYGVKMEKVDLTAQPVPAIAAAVVEATPEAQAVRTTLGEPRPKRRTNRPAKRRR
ncbi:MAG: hypothetical protein WAV20_17310 [Blastocatellia bacterium]